MENFGLSILESVPYILSVLSISSVKNIVNTREFCDTLSEGETVRSIETDPFLFFPDPFTVF